MNGKILLVGKSVLGEKGFCMAKSKMQDESGNSIFETQLAKVLKEIPNDKETICVSLTAATELEELKYDYIPGIELADVKRHNPESIFKMADYVGWPMAPQADFIMWSDEEINVMAYTRTAPVIYFEAANGMKCLGTILRKSLVNHGEYFFKKVFGLLKASEENPVEVSILSCTNYFYEDMNSNIPDYIENMLMKNPNCTGVMRVFSPQENSDECYNVDEVGNHVLAII